MQHTSRDRVELRIVILLAVLGASSWLASRATVHADTSAGQYLVQQGDALQLYVFDEETLTGVHMVGAAGTITLPVLGDVAVAGKTIADIRQLLAGRISEVIRDPVVNVRIDEERSSRLVFVSGSVEKKGSMSLPFGASVRDAVVAAGPQDRADLGRVALSRAGQPQQEIDLRGLRTDYSLHAPVPLQYGDVIHVPRSENVVSILGEVQQPAVLLLPEGEKLTVLEAIGKLGQGFGPEADTGAALLLRRDLDEPIRIDLHALLKAGDVSQNLELQGGDVLLVKRTEEIAVVGQVNNPVVFHSSEPVKVTEAVIRAGGFNASSDLANATVFRDGQYTPVDLQSLWKAGDMSHNIALMAGDTLIVPEKVPEEIMLLGALENVGPMSIANMHDTGLLKIVTLARPTQQADLRKVQVYRSDEHLTVNLKMMEQQGDLSADIQLQAGDVIVVNDALKVYVIGAVGKPGIYPYDPDRSLLDYVTEAGLGQAVGLQIGALVRAKEDGTSEVISLDMSRLREGQLPADVVVRAGDIIYFPPPKQRKSFWDYMRENLWILNLFHLLFD